MCISGVEHLPGMHWVLDLNVSLKKQTNKQGRKERKEKRKKKQKETEGGAYIRR